ncbi:hypothetical protein [Cellulomonas hominis]
MTRSPYLEAAGASWDDGPEAGAWIGERLGPFGASLGHAVPSGYEAYAVVPVPPDDEDAADPHGLAPYRTLEALLTVLAPVTGDQRVHCGLWTGWGFLRSAGEDPRTALGMSVMVAWAPEGGRPSAEEIDRLRAEAVERMAATRVERPAADVLELPHRAYHLWTGPLRAALALRHQQHELPSLVWPQDRSWFVGAPIYTNELAVGGSRAVVAAVLADPRLGGRPATPADLLDIDD